MNGTWSVEFDLDRFARVVASHVIDSINEANFANRLAHRVGEVVAEDIRPDTPQGWHREYTDPAISSYCWLGEHSSCDGSAAPSERGCQCPQCSHHRPAEGGEPRE